MSFGPAFFIKFELYLSEWVIKTYVAPWMVWWKNDVTVAQEDPKNRNFKSSLEFFTIRMLICTCCAWRSAFLAAFSASFCCFFNAFLEIGPSLQEKKKKKNYVLVERMIQFQFNFNKKINKKKTPT